jgi:hypothetical protein
MASLTRWPTSVFKSTSQTNRFKQKKQVSIGETCFFVLLVTLLITDLAIKFTEKRPLLERVGISTKLGTSYRNRKIASPKDCRT